MSNNIKFLSNEFVMNEFKKEFDSMDKGGSEIDFVTVMAKDVSANKIGLRSFFNPDYWEKEKDEMKKLCKKFKIPFNENTEIGLTNLLSMIQHYMHFTNYILQVELPANFLNNYGEQFQQLYNKVSKDVIEGVNYGGN